MALPKYFRLKLQGLCVGAVLFPAAIASAQQEYIVVDLGQIAGAIIPIMIQEVHLNDLDGPYPPSLQLPVVQVINVADAQGILTPVRIIDGQTTPLGTLGGEETEAHGVNFYPLNPANNVRIVGASQAVDSFFHAFSWSEGGGMIELEGLGGDESSAKAINDVRQIVGWAQDGLGVTHAVIWDGLVGPTDLSLVANDMGPPAKASDIDNFGHIVGQSERTGKAQATAWVRGPTEFFVLDLGALGGDESEALAVEVGRTNAGITPSFLVAAGWSEVTPGGARHAAMWDVDTITEIVVPIDLGTLGGVESVAISIAAYDPLVGELKAVGWSDIAPPLSSARSATRIRSRAKSAAGGGVLTHAFIYDATNGMRDLNDLIDSFSGWELIRADSLNSSGMISGIGELNGVLHAFRLDPINPPQACPFDTDGSGTVNVFDLLDMLGSWGVCP